MICLTTSVGAFRLRCIRLRLATLQAQLSISRDRGGSRGQSKHSLNQALVNPHLVRIPCLAALTARCLPGCHLQAFGGQADWAFDAEVLGFGALDQLLADFLEGLDFARCEGDADFVDFLPVLCD